MEKYVLKATRRTVTGKKVGTLRREGQLPGVLYGPHIEPTPISMEFKETSRYLGTLTASSLVTISVDGSEHAALVREKQRDYIRGTLLHVDFQAVSLTEKLRTHVGIQLTGVSPAVKDLNGMVVTNVDELEVECLPSDLPERILLDISRLANIGDGLYVRDVVLPDVVQVLSDPNELLVVVTHAVKEEVEEVAAPEEVAAEEPEVIERGKKEEEVEGEEAKE